MVGDWLRKHGHDGLCDEDRACGCALDNLMPCGEPGIHCEAGRRIPCNGRCDSGHCDFHVVPSPGNRTTEEG